MAKINFTKEHYVKMSDLAFAMLVNNETISSKIGQPLNIVELMHTTTVQTLNDMRLNIGKQIEKLESQDEWVSTDNTQERLEKLKKQKELLNLLIGWKRKKLETEEAQYKKRTLTEQLNKLKEEQKTPEDRIKELEEQLRNLSLQYAELEGVEFAIQLYARKRIDMLEERINSMFSFVRFRMYEQQINGGEVETCKAMVDGVPYEDLNHAARINAGLDIIAAFCRRLDVSAPIFVDNAEAVNRLMTDSLTSQIIRLIVSGDKNLKIEKTQK